MNFRVFKVINRNNQNFRVAWGNARSVDVCFRGETSDSNYIFMTMSHKGNSVRFVESWNVQ